MAPQHDTITALTRTIREHQLSVPILLDRYLNRISQKDKVLGAFLHVMDVPARERAGQLQTRIDSGDWPGPLTGIPIAVKDNISVTGAPLTAGSRILEQFKPLYNATAISRLEAAGAICIGKTNLDEFAMGSSNEFSAYFPARNPWSIDHVPGGSSGGSAAAVAAGLAVGGLGSDTGGSVRQPAAFCGLVGFKPAYGAVSRYGLIAFASSMDQIGPLAATARDCALLYQTIAGADENDATSSGPSVAFAVDSITAAPPKLRIGIADNLAQGQIDEEVRTLFAGACERLSGWGHELVSIPVPDPDLDLAVYHILADGEASSNLARYDGVFYGLRLKGSGDLIDLYRRNRGTLFGREVKRRILLGTFVLSAGYYDAYYQKALVCRAEIRNQYQRLYRDLDLLLMPTTPAPAFRLAEKTADPIDMYRCDRFTIAANLTGDPAISFPIGQTRTALPVGAQLTGPRGSEIRLFQLAHQFDLALPAKKIAAPEMPAPEVES